MPFSFPTPHVFSAQEIRAYAPSTPGLFGLSNERQWLLIQGSDDIQAALLRLVAERSATIVGLNATGFVFEPCDARSQASRQNRLVLEYEPVANRRFSNHLRANG